MEGEGEKLGQKSERDIKKKKSVINLKFLVEHNGPLSATVVASFHLSFLLISFKIRWNQKWFLYSCCYVFKTSSFMSVCIKVPPFLLLSNTQRSLKDCHSIKCHYRMTFFLHASPKPTTLPSSRELATSIWVWNGVKKTITQLIS